MTIETEIGDVPVIVTYFLEAGEPRSIHSTGKAAEAEIVSITDLAGAPFVPSEAEFVALQTRLLIEGGPK